MTDGAYPPARDKVPCPACGASIVWEPTRDGPAIPCDPQLRLVIFEGEEIDADPRTLTPKKMEEMIGCIEVGTATLVYGRNASDKERNHFREHKTLNGLVPWTLGRHSHYRSCTGWDLWRKGKVAAPTLEMDPVIALNATIGYGAGESGLNTEATPRRAKGTASGAASSSRRKGTDPSTDSSSSMTGKGSSLQSQLFGSKR